MKYLHVGEVIHGVKHACLDIWDLHSLQATAETEYQSLLLSPLSGAFGYSADLHPLTVYKL